MTFRVPCNACSPLIQSGECTSKAGCLQYRKFAYGGNGMTGLAGIPTRGNIMTQEEIFGKIPYIPNILDLLNGPGLNINGCFGK